MNAQVIAAINECNVPLRAIVGLLTCSQDGDRDDIQSNSNGPIYGFFISFDINRRGADMSPVPVL